MRTKKRRRGRGGGLLGSSRPLPYPARPGATRPVTCKRSDSSPGPGETRRSAGSTGPTAMASVGVVSGRPAEETLPQPQEPPMQEQKPLPAPQPPPPPQQPPPQPQPSASVLQPPPPPGLKEEETYSFLPLVHDVIKCMDKDSVDMHQELTALKSKFQEMRKVISTMPGINSSPEQQQQQLQSLREQVRTKNELLQKYKSLCMFEIPKE
ncbi:mediator of RNA polymerase II transcription subunit 9 [Macrotis lagotis]|uniref:mediator of RNA polymerase II transcription subunit 9 n=1 Tax=Macrotis lagotis TaxID=92651 RepID=UPI003D696E5A